MIFAGGVSIALYFYENASGAPLAGIQPVLVGLALDLVITISGSLLDKPERDKHARFLAPVGIARSTAEPGSAHRRHFGAKLVAGRMKDMEFVDAIPRHGPHRR